MKVDHSYFNGYPLHNGLEINKIFNIEMQQASFNELISVTWPFYNYRIGQIGIRILPKRKTVYCEKTNAQFIDIDKLAYDCYLDGYWQNELYFKDCEDIVRRKYQFITPLDLKNNDLKNKICSVNSVSIHVRRGDYLKHKMYLGLCDKDYYVNAISYMKKKIDHPVFFVFSNDINWCKSNLRDVINDSCSEYIDWNKKGKSYIDMQLMSICKHNIIANSSFSWWGAWLNNNIDKIVIAPKKWLNIELIIQPQCKDWILI
ncbi:MAG: alpha-1,2-fucosyltransferase [Bacteroidales bacterium]|nr:alpha-1,2-fucosyltransferase [Bacteroidales bacterium]